MSVHYKFKSALEYDTVTFDGLHISVKDLKKAILQQKKIGKTSDFDLQVTNAQTKETYTDENVLIPKNASLIIARVPLTQQQKKLWEKEKLAANAKPGEIAEQGTLSQVDISSLDLSEEEKIKTMITQSTSDYDPANYVKVRGGNQVGTVPASYICFKCHQHGHWIKDCPSTIDSANMGMTDTIKKSTGIPRSFMIEVEGPQVPGARMTPSGIYAVPAIDHEVYKEKKIEKPPFLAEKEKPPPAPAIPEDLICGICKDLLQDAVMIPCCGISFCDECIRNVLVDSEESECPDCNEKNVSPDTLIPNRFLRNSVNTFKNKTGYVKSKPKLIQQRPPSPPRPSLPDFVPPPDYVDPTTVKESEPTTNAGLSPACQSSPADALQIYFSPSQNQTPPVCTIQSPYNEEFSFPDQNTVFVNSPFPPDFYQYQSFSPSCQKPFGLEYNTSPLQNIFESNFFEGFVDSGSSGPFFNPVRCRIDTRCEQNIFEVREMQKDFSIPSLDANEDSRAAAFSEDFSKANLSQDFRIKENIVSGGIVIEKESSKLDKLKKAGIDIDDVSSVSSNASEEPPPPVENRRPNEGQPDPSQGPSYAIPSLFSGQHPVILPPPGSEPYPPPRPGDAFVHGGAVDERSGTPTVDERLEVPPIRPLYDPYRAPNYIVPSYEQHYGMPHPMPMGYDSNMMYDNRGFRGMPRGPRVHRGRYAMRQPPPPGSRPLTPPRNEEEAYLAFQRMLKEKEERDKRKNEKLKLRRSTSRSRSRSATRSRRSFSGARSRSRTRSRTPPRRTRSRSKKRSRTRSRSFVMSRSRSRSYSRSPLHERNYSPKKYYSPHRSPIRFDRYESNYGPWVQDIRDYRRGRFRGRGRGRFFKNSPPRAHEHQSYNRSHGCSGENSTLKPKEASGKTAPEDTIVTKAYSRYRDENYASTSPRHCRSPSRYYDQRLSPRCSDYPRDSRERDYRSYERETDSAARDRNTRRRSHSNSLIRNQYDTERERDRDKEKHRERDRDRDNEYRRRSRSRRSRSRRYTPVRKPSQERSERSKEKSPERRKDWDKEKDENHRNRDRRSYENDKDKRIYTGERDHSKEFESKRRAKSRSRSRDKSRHDKDRGESKDKKKRSLSLDKQRGKDTGSRKHRSSSRRRSLSRSKDEKVRSPANGSNRDGHKKVDNFEKDRDKHSISRERDELNKNESKEKGKEQTKALSPKAASKEDEEKKEKKKDKEKKKRKKEKETEEERAARKKRKKEKKEEKKRKQEMKNKLQESDLKDERSSEPKDLSAADVSGSNNFITGFKPVRSEEEEELKSSPLGTENQNNEDNLEIEKEKRSRNNFDLEAPEKEFSKVPDESNGLSRKLENPEEMEVDGNLDEYNNELQIHASYESLLEENGEPQKKGILVSVPEISKWELDENQVSDFNQKTTNSDGKSPDHSAKVTREVIKRAENAIFKKAVNAIREPVKKTNDKDEKKDKKVILTSEKDRNRDYRSDQESDKMKRMFLLKEKDKFHHTNLELNRPKQEVKKTVNSLQITIPVNNDGKGAERQFSVDEDGVKVKSQQKDKNSSKSPPPCRVPIKERLGSKIDKQGRHGSPHVIRTVEKRSWNEKEEDSKSNRKDYQRPPLSSAVESIDAKRSSIDEAHFVPNYDESSDEIYKAVALYFAKVSGPPNLVNWKPLPSHSFTICNLISVNPVQEENVKSRFSNEKEIKFGEGADTKKRLRSSSESSEESTKKHKKKKKSKSKKKKLKKSKKHLSDSSDSSDSEREKKKHKKSKKKKKSRH